MIETAPAAAFEAQALVFGPLDKKNVVDVVACEGASCAGTDDKAAKSHVSLTPDQTGTLTLLVEVTGGVAIGGAKLAGGASGAGFAPQAAPAFQPVLGGGGPDQVFQMQQRADARNAFTTALLLGRRLSPCSLIGFGPSLLVGGSGAVLSQWNLHFGWSPSSTKNLYFTLGPSVRFVPQPDFYKIGDIVSVPLPSGGGNAVPPTFSTHTGAVFQLDFGIAIDIGGAASSMSSVVSSFGGSK